MPSNRRVKILGLTVALIVVSILYISSTARQSNEEFYSRTVAALNAQEDRAAKAASDELIAQKLRDAERSAKLQEAEGGAKSHQPMVPDEAKAEVKKIEAVVEEEGKSGSSNPARVGERGRKKGDGGEKWDVSSGKQAVLDEKNSGSKAKEEKTEEEKDVEAELNSILKRSPIIIFSKSYCPHSRRAKNVFGLYHIVPDPYIVELDQHPLGAQIQASLKESTGRGTVPNVLINGKSIGGGDEVVGLHDKGELVAKVRSMAGKRVLEVGLKEEKR